jgi:hypothetical protein
MLRRWREGYAVRSRLTALVVGHDRRGKHWDADAKQLLTVADGRMIQGCSIATAGLRFRGTRSRASRLPFHKLIDRISA